MTDRLCKDIETAIRRQMQTPKDFDFLRERIYARLHALVSRTTLMRLWGYVVEEVEPRKSTLDILARFLGYNDFEEYQHNADVTQEQQSSPVISRRLSVIHDLSRGSRVRLTWQPMRVCDVEYLGNLTFRVVASENTRLRTGDTFQCNLIVEGEPLYIDNLRQGDQPPMAYVCGKKSGVWFEVLVVSSNFSHDCKP